MVCLSAKAANGAPGNVEFLARAFESFLDAVLEPGNVLCVEALVSPEGGDFSIKLEDQVLITETGYDNLTSYPFDERLLGHWRAPSSCGT